jgi:hypothetical protein
MRTNKMRINLKAIMALLMAMLLTPVAGATGIDLHWLWDDRCAECHGHSGNFARLFLNVSGGELQGRHHVYDLHHFMHNHYLLESEVDAVYDMLLAQASSQARFRQVCSSCHGTAVNFVRSSLELHDGLLFSRKYGRPVYSFLDNHMGLSPDDVEFFTKQLTRVAHEVYRP